MLNKCRRMLIIAITVILVFGMVLSNSTVFADSLNDRDLNSSFYNSIQTFLVENYKGYYDLDNFEIELEESSDYKDSWIVSVTCDMTLIKSSEELPFLKGMKAGLKQVNIEPSNFSGYEKISSEIKEQYFLKPERTTFNFLIGKNDEKVVQNLLVLNFKEVTSIDSLKIEDEQLFKKGKDTIFNNMEDRDIRINAYSSSYDRIGARDYALDHANDTPEYSSDCANFVSQCLCYGGGIPQSSSWSPGKPNWIRTGYNHNGGVAPYMVDNGYFYREYDRRVINAGCIVYWNTFSHVGLITYGDTVTIKYSAHTTARRNEVLSPNANVSFYMYK